MYLSIIVLPILGSLVSGLLGRKVGVTGSHIVTCGSLIISSLLITIAFYEVGLCGSPVYINIGTWLDSEILNISWEFYFDQLTVSLGLAVIYCSTLIHIYSISYLAADPAMHYGKMLKREKLSNSGNTLKLFILNYIWKYISGWTNYSGIVKNKKMKKTEMGYRGSKSRSVLQTDLVKEQRVDGSYCIAKKKIICN